MLHANLLAEDLFEGWGDFTNQFLSIILTALVISIICLVYNVKIRGHEEGQRMSGFLVLMEMFITSVENLVVNSMGKKYRKLTPYAMYIIMYIVIGSIISLIGVESLATSYTVAFCMGFVTFVAIYYFGFKYQKLAYFKKYANPIELLTQFTPLISISFRLFGNLLGGSIILGLVYALFIGIQTEFSGVVMKSSEIWGAKDTGGIGTWSYEDQYQYFWAGFNIFTTLFTPFMHMYFDLFDAGVQSIVFTMLTLSYWAEAMGEEHEGKEPERRGSELKSEIPHKGNKKELAIQIAM